MCRTCCMDQGWVGPGVGTCRTWRMDQVWVGPRVSVLQCLSLFPADSNPTLKDLFCFPMPGGKVNLAEKIGFGYYEFGILLLEDDVGDRIAAIEREQRDNVSKINREVFRLWLKGKGRQPVTWATLVAVLQDIGMMKLARDIEAVKVKGL